MCFWILVSNPRTDTFELSNDMQFHLGQITLLYFIMAGIAGLLLTQIVGLTAPHCSNIAQGRMKMTMAFFIKDMAWLLFQSSIGWPLLP